MWQVGKVIIVARGIGWYVGNSMVLNLLKLEIICQNLLTMSENTIFCRMVPEIGLGFDIGLMPATVRYLDIVIVLPKTIYMH